MTMKLKAPPEFDTVPKNQRIAFVQELWDRIAQDPGRVPIPDKHIQILEERLNAYRSNPKSGRPWNEVREELLASLHSS